MLRKGLLLLGLLLVLSVALAPVMAQDDFKLTIVHTNDEHAAHQPQGGGAGALAGSGGAARLATVVNAIRGEGGNVLLLDAGDRFTGTLFHTVYQGQDQVKVMNLLGYNAMTLGNHEFDLQREHPEVLENFVAGVNFPVVSANIDFSKLPALDEKVSAYTVLEVGGDKVGVIGLITPEAAILANPSPDIGFIEDLAGVANAAVDELTGMGINKIVLLTHIGLNVAQGIAPQLHGVDIFIDGHTHTLLSNTLQTLDSSYKYPMILKDSEDKPIYYAQAGSNSIYVGRMNIVFDPEGVVKSAAGDTILLSHYITPDPAMDALVTELAAPVEELKNQTIGATSDVALVGDRAVCRVEECTMGNVIADALRAETGAQIAIVNGGGVRANMDAGDITLGDVLTVQPFGNLTSTFSLVGADLITALENGVSRVEVADGKVKRDGAQGRFPQVSGIRYSFDPTQEAGKRIVSVEVLAEDGTYVPLDPAATYTIVTNNFARQGGDGYSIFQTNAINPYDYGRVDYEVLVDYLVKNSPLNPQLEGRITIVNAELAPLS